MCTCRERGGERERDRERKKINLQGRAEASRVENIGEREREREREREKQKKKQREPGRRELTFFDSLQHNQLCTFQAVCSVGPRGVGILSYRV